MKLTLGFSPCPNDTFIFDALVNKKIDTAPFEFDMLMEDVQTLNQWSVDGRLDISKISYGVFPLITHQYDLLDAGGALGKGVGPLLIAKKQMPDAAIHEGRIAIPGKDTTAHLLFSWAFPAAQHKEFMVFSTIEKAVLDGRVDFGVIIHENRFTYRQRGLVEITDLGARWEQQTGCPIPLGGIVMKNSYEDKIQKKINALIRQSVEYALGNYPQLPDFVKLHAQEMDETVMRQHIVLYVNNYSLSLGKEGEEAVITLGKVYASMNKTKLQPVVRPIH
jgi:1,4-dihydroxy-6-naphthoate synthase